MASTREPPCLTSDLCTVAAAVGIHRGVSKQEKGFRICPQAWGPRGCEMTWPSWKKKRRRLERLSSMLLIASIAACVFIAGNLYVFISGMHSFGGTRSRVVLSESFHHSNPAQRTMLTEALGEIGSRLMFGSVKSSQLRKLMQDSLSHETLNEKLLFQTENVRDSKRMSAIYNSLKIGSNCDEIWAVKDLKRIGSGWTKSVFQSLYRGQNVALKTVDHNGHDVTECLKNGDSSREICHKKAAKKILKEVALLNILHNDHIVKIQAYCIPDTNALGDNSLKVAMATELGESIDLIRLLQMSWEDRLRVSLGLTKLVDFMSSSPLGSLAMNDFRRQQFVMVDGEIKLTDVDDVSSGDPVCTRDQDCTQHFSSSNFTINTTCLYGRCVGYNERMNVFNTGRHFTTFLLPHGTPRALRPLVDQIVDGFRYASAPPNKLLALMKKLVELYKSGQYLKRNADISLETKYRELNNRDLPGMFDYACKSSIGGAGCTVSVFDIKEAEDICNEDEECKSFVISPYKTWTGRLVAHMKNGVAQPQISYNRTLFIKPK